MSYYPSWEETIIIVVVFGLMLYATLKLKKKDAKLKGEIQNCKC